ncbi:MAG: hypothetical protein ABIP35_04410 [Ginsengibacter sp.]
MKASLKAKFSIADIKKSFAEFSENFDQVIIERLSFVGEKFLVNARNNGNYTDQTGNLRSSIGYAIIKDGEFVVTKYNTSTKQKKSKKKNLAAPQERNVTNSLLASIAEKFPKGFVLVGLAGMEYAAYVESKNKDVITSSAITAENDLSSSLDELRMKLSGKKR